MVFRKGEGITLRLREINMNWRNNVPLLETEGVAMRLDAIRLCHL